ncbi:MAG: efflux RND transporter periplasmic adaptor subunit [Bacteroidaceae bacterium]|nr:efflux RND transporter periplasmic adaptor subunit [Bacteroidaceae bacterium]
MGFRRIAALLLAVGSFGVAAAMPAAVIKYIPTVTCITPQPMLYEKRINASGTIEANKIKEIYLETPVIAKSVNVSVGDYVKKDQILATIDTQLTKSIVKESIPSQELINLFSEDLHQAANLTSLYSALQSSAFGANIGSLEDLVTSAYGTAAEPVTPNSYIYIPETITAPMEGVVTCVEVKNDVLSRTAKPLVTISDTSSYMAMVTVGESYSSDIQIGDRAIITGTGFSDKSYEGHISKIYPVARKASGVAVPETVVDVEIAIDNPDESLKAGFTARAEIITNSRRNMLTIPYEAIQQDENNVEYVYIVQDSKAVRRDIKTGLELLEGVEVTDGLVENELLVSNASSIKTGVRVRLLRG